MDDGSYPYAKDIGRVLAKTTLNSTYRGIIDAVFDKTYGWHDNDSQKKVKIKQRKTEEKIDFNFFEEFTGLPFTKLSTALKQLVEWKILRRKKQSRSYIYSFNTIVKEWDRQVFKKIFQKEKWGKVYHIVNFTKQETLPNDKAIVPYIVNSQFTRWGTKKSQDPHHEKNTEALNNSLNNSFKITKSPKTKYTFSDEDMVLTNLLKNGIQENKPDYYFKGNNYKEKWANEVRLMRIGKENRSLERIEKVIDFALTDSFWKINILSMDKLREKFDILELKMREKAKNKGESDTTPPYLEPFDKGK